jgi:hypothetical protein
MHRETERGETSVVFFILPANRGGGGAAWPAGRGGSGGEGRPCGTRGPMRTHRCTRHGMACSEEAGPRAPTDSSCAAAVGCAPVVTLAKGEVREVRHEGRKVVRWFDLAKECLVVAGHGALRTGNGGHERCGVRAHEQGRRGRGRAGEGEWKAQNGARRVP